MPEIREDETPIIFIELFEKGDSGFVKQGTEGTPFEERLQFPSRRYLPTVGKRQAKKMTERVVNGKKQMVETTFAETIRWVHGETEISLDRQKQLGIEPENNGKWNKLAVDKGYLTVAREGSSVGLFDYLEQCFYNADATGRSDRATKLWRVIQKDKDAELFNEAEMVAADAVKYVSTLYQKVGERQYKYNEQKIDALCSLMTIWAETNAAKIQALLMNAKLQPKEFMELVTKWENTTNTEVTQALKLGVIQFDKNMVVSVKKEKVYYSLGTENLKQPEKVERFADWLRTSDGHEAYMELKAEIELAMENQLKQ